MDVLDDARRGNKKRSRAEMGKVGSRERERERGVIFLCEPTLYHHTVDRGESVEHT